MSGNRHASQRYPMNSTQPPTPRRKRHHFRRDHYLCGVAQLRSDWARQRAQRGYPELEIIERLFPNRQQAERFIREYPGLRQAAIACLVGRVPEHFKPFEETDAGKKYLREWRGAQFALKELKPNRYQQYRYLDILKKTKRAKDSFEKALRVYYAEQGIDGFWYIGGLS